MSFIERNCDKAPLLLKAFKDLYNDRSMFVHTGISLHAEGSVRPHRPLILKGKHFKSDLPKYWHNIHDFTGLVLRNNLYKSLFSELNLRKDWSLIYSVTTMTHPRFMIKFFWKLRIQKRRNFLSGPSFPNWDHSHFKCPVLADLRHWRLHCSKASIIDPWEDEPASSQVDHLFTMS